MRRYSFVILLVVSCMVSHIKPIVAQQYDVSKHTAMSAPVHVHADTILMQAVSDSLEHFGKSKQRGYKQFKRVEEYMMSRLGPSGEIVNTGAKNLKAYEELTKTSATPTQRNFSYNGSWDFLGPVDMQKANGNHTDNMGRVNRIGFHPTDENILYAATAGGGIWKSVDKGADWTPISDGVPVMNMSGVVIDPEDPNILYALSGDGNGVGSFYYFNSFARTSVGVFKTYNDGAIWEPTGLIFDETSAVFAYNILMKPDDNQTLYVCTNIGLFRTSNGGDTWDTIRNSLVYELEFKPGDPDRIYVVDKKSVFVSDDGGTSWIDSTRIPDIDGQNGRMCISVCESNPAFVYVVASPVDSPISDSIPDFRGLWLSPNSGEDFILMATRPNITAGSNPLEFDSQASYDFTLECNPLDENQIIVGAIGVWKSNDNGVTWTHDDGINNLYHADVHSIEVNPLDNTMYMCTDGGAYRSDDFGVSYEFISKYLNVTQYYKVSNSPLLADVTLAGAQDNGVQLRNENELLFDHVYFGDGMYSAFHPLDAGLAYGCCQFGDVAISHDTGKTFVVILPNLKGNDSVDWTIPIAIDATDPQVLYVGYRPVIKSTDQGSTFFGISPDSVTGHRILVNHASFPQVLYAGDCSSCLTANPNFEIHRTRDDGVSWERIDVNTGFPDDIFISSLAVHPTDTSQVWITCGQYEAGKKVYYSQDAGQSWENISGSLPNTPVNSIVLHEYVGGPTGALYIATDIGVFYRDDAFQDWIYFSNNLPLVEVTDLAIDHVKGTIKAVTYGRGMWESELITSCQPTLILNPLNQVEGLSYQHQASQQILSTAHVSGLGSRVVYGSENIIRLSEGFRARAQHGAMFNAILKACGEGGVEDPLMGQEGKK